MATRIGINGFGRMGRLAIRAGWGRPDLEFVHINEVAGGPEAAAHLLTFDSVHGRWNRRVESGAKQITIEDTHVGFSAIAKPGDVPWAAHRVDVVLECSGKFRTTETPEVRRPTTVEEVNAAFKRAAEGALNGILGCEERPLVSIDFKDDTCSAIVDAPSTMVVDGTCVKVLAWYDNEIGYVNRMIELAQKVGASL